MRRTSVERNLVWSSPIALHPRTPLSAPMFHTHLKRFQWQFQISAALPDIAATFSNAYLTSLCVVIVNQHCCTPVSQSPSLPSLPLLYCNCVFNCAGLTLLGFCFHSTRAVTGTAPQQSCLCRCQLSSLCCFSLSLSLSLSLFWSPSLSPSLSVCCRVKHVEKSFPVGSSCS